MVCRLLQEDFIVLHFHGLGTFESFSVFIKNLKSELS
jgi:hypothetical protein